MTLSEALKKLRPPLKFGDPEQIVAVDFVACVASCVQAIAGCNHQPNVCAECNGTGKSECRCSDCGHVHTAECSECDGDGTPARGCAECLKAFTPIIQTEAAYVHVNGWPRFWWKE